MIIGWKLRTRVSVFGLTGGLIIGASFAAGEVNAQTAPSFDPKRFVFEDPLLGYAPKQGRALVDQWQPPERAKPVSHFYAGAEYLLWWVKGAPLSVPLVSTGPIATTHHGLLGPPAEDGADSTVLYGAPHSPAQGGNDTQNFPGFSGTRLTLGYRVDDPGRLAFEASGFVLQSQSAGYSARGGSDGNPVLGIPVHNSVSYSIGSMIIFPGEDSLPFSLPSDPARARGNDGVLTGGIDITNKLQLWGIGATSVVNLYRTSNWEVSGLVGFRYLDLAESFHLVVNIEGVSGMYAGQSGVAQDLFETRNQFYGVMLGLRGRYAWGRVSLALSGGAAVGVSHETIDVSGGFTSVNFGPSSGPEGVFAQPANEGRTSRNHFAVVPEATAKLGYDLTPWLTVSIGYDILYYSNVVRPTDQIDRNIPKGQTFLQAATTISTTSPSRLFNTTDFYAQGLNVGLTARF